MLSALSLLSLVAVAQLDAGAVTPEPKELSSTAPWVFVETEGGVRLDKRDVKGSAYAAYRAMMTADVPVDAFCTSVFDWGSYAAHDEVSVRKLLADEGDVRVVYDQVQQKVVSDRDYAMTQRRWTENGACHIRFWVTNERAPDRPKGFVRMEHMWGAWDFAPSDKGTQVTYVLFSDPAGSVPAFLVHGAQKRSVHATMHAALERAKAGTLPPHP